jgi:hypothetical protein
MRAKKTLSRNNFLKSKLTLIFSRKEDHPKLKQTRIDFSTEKPVTQDLVDRRILDFIVETGQAFTIVNEPSFQKLVTTFQPKRTVFSYRTLMSR